MEAPRGDVFTIGHSTRSIDQFVRLLRNNGIELLVDVRTAPGSRRMPHFNRLELEQSLPEHGIRYLHLPQLGGLRKPRPDSTNGAWRNSSFRGYADFMQEPVFGEALDQLMDLSRKQSVAIMCAEAVPWRCHRNLIADALVVRGVDVQHIVGEANSRPHRLNPMAVVKGGHIIYP